MRARKYYDAVRSNNSFYSASFSQKKKIIKNMFLFFLTNLRKKEIIKNKPMIAQIEPNSTCNLKCQMCIREKIGVPIGTMTFKNFKIIVDKLDCLFKLHLSGQGEPFLNPELFSMIKYANQRGASVFFTTNGTVLTKEIINKICEVDIGEMAVSLDSPIKEKYEAIRKGANFDQVIKNVKELTKQIKEKKKKTIVGLTTIIFKENIKELPEFVKLADFLGIKKIGFQKLQEKKDYTDKYGSFAKNQRVKEMNKEILKEIELAKKLAKEKGITLIFDEEKSLGCIWPWRSIYITWNGFVTPCCKILDYRTPSFGNLLEEDLESIWNGKEYQKYRKFLKKRKALPSCVGCSSL